MMPTPGTVLAVLALRAPYWGRSWRHRVAARLLLLVYAYLGVLLLLLALENRFVFVPTLAAEHWQPPPPDLDIEDVELTSGDGTRLHAWWMTPSDWRPEHGALLYCHGNGGNLSHRGPRLREYRDRLGQAVLIFDYPGYGRSGGRPSEAGCYAAADAAYDWLTGSRRVAGERVILHGVSLGCGVATELASRRPHRALVLVSPFSSMGDMAQWRFPCLPARWLVRNRFDNLAKIRAVRRPVFIAHGTADRVVPYGQGERLFAAANEPKQFFPLPGLDHNDSPPPAFYDAVRDFLAACERPAN